MAEKQKKEHGLHESQAKYCEGCGKKIHVNAKTCPHCGYTTKKSEEKATKKTLAIVGLILNVIIWPGLGTIIGGDVGKGIGQMVLFLISIPLIFILIGIPLLIGVWIWALVSSINQIKRSE